MNLITQFTPHPLRAEAPLLLINIAISKSSVFFSSKLGYEIDTRFEICFLTPILNTYQTLSLRVSCFRKSVADSFYCMYIYSFSSLHPSQVAPRSPVYKVCSKETINFISGRLEEIADAIGVQMAHLSLLGHSTIICAIYPELRYFPRGPRVCDLRANAQVNSRIWKVYCLLTNFRPLALLQTGCLPGTLRNDRPTMTLHHRPKWKTFKSNRTTLQKATQLVILPVRLCIAEYGEEITDPHIFPLPVGSFWLS